VTLPISVSREAKVTAMSHYIWKHNDIFLHVYTSNELKHDLAGYANV
jgi:hypothetical protein